MIKQTNSFEIIHRVLTTPLGSTVMRPWFGSLLFELVDKTVDDEWILDATRYTYEAIERYEENKKNYPSMSKEPEIIVKKVQITMGEAALFHIEYEEEGRSKSINLGFGEVVNATV